MTTKKSNLINPKIQGVATAAFNRAFGDSIDYDDPKVATLVLAYAALLELGAEYIELRAFKRVHDHLLAELEVPKKHLTKKEGKENGNPS